MLRNSPHMDVSVAVAVIPPAISTLFPYLCFIEVKSCHTSSFQNDDLVEYIDSMLDRSSEITISQQ